MGKYFLHSIPIFLIGFLPYFICDGFEVSLSEKWTIMNRYKSISIHNQTLPSGVYSALENANITGSVLQSFNDVNLRWIAREEWTYLLRFAAPEAYVNFSSTFLVFHGIDTIATIELNGIELTPSPQNMFVRYRYDVTQFLQEEQNELSVRFESPIKAAALYASQRNFTPPECPPSTYNGECHMNFLRKMQASFSWDWGLAAISVGIWKPVVLELFDDVIIRDVTYNLESSDNTWTINVTVYMDVGHYSQYRRSLDGILSVRIDGISATVDKRIFIPGLDGAEISINIPFEVRRDDVKLWWPNGYGEQSMYTLNVTFQNENRNVNTNEIRETPSAFSKSVRIGFRTIELIENPIANGNTFYFKVNGVPIFLKGSNWIPMDILPEKMFDLAKLKHLLGAARDAHMNTLRVWGGGVYESDEFYKLTDEYGILVWQDMMFACAMYPVYPEFIESVRTEIAQNVRRLQGHPSILLWSGNNENEAALVQNWYGTGSNRRFVDEYLELYTEIYKTVRINDNWHIWLYSSPSNGIKIGTIINRNPQDNNYGDVHYYNYLSDGWDLNIFPRARFVSEYGFQSFPSLINLQYSLNPNDNILNVLNHRQHFPMGSRPILALIQRHLNLPSQNATNYLSVSIYYSQLSQAIATKTETETYRVGRYHAWKTMGALYWQLNDVWVAPSWSGIEYNGNFKILQYFAKDFLAPTHVILNLDPLNNVNIYVVRDSLGPVTQLKVELKVFRWSQLSAASQHTWNVQMEENSVVLLDRRNINLYLNNSTTRANSFMYITLSTPNGETVATNFLLLEKLKNSVGIQKPNLLYEITNNGCNSETGHHETTVKVTVTAPAVFVYIQIKHEEIHNFELSRNGFIQVKPIENFTISFSNPNCVLNIEEENIIILTVNDFIN